MEKKNRFLSILWICVTDVLITYKAKPALKTLLGVLEALRVVAECCGGNRPCCTVSAAHWQLLSLFFFFTAKYFHL